ncbi:MAG: hypothetical protein AAFU73_16455 [Planctomycetota bacterium]
MTRRPSRPALLAAAALLLAPASLAQRAAGSLGNPSFETGSLASWTVVEQTVTQPIWSVLPATASSSFTLGSTPTNGLRQVFGSLRTEVAAVHSIDQNFIVEPGTTALRFDHRAFWISTPLFGIGPTTADRRVSVILRDTAGAVLRSATVALARAGETVSDTGLQTLDLDVAPFGGQTVNVAIEISTPEPFRGLGGVYIDDFRCVGAPRPSIGTAFCVANFNSTGFGGRLSATGSTVAAANDVELAVERIPPGQFGLFLVAPGAAGALPVNSGVLCLTGPTGRLDQPGLVWQADVSGRASRALDLQRIPTPTALVATAPGDTWHFQAWYRDTLPGDSNLTAGVRIAFN